LEEKKRCGQKVVKLLLGKGVRRREREREVEVEVINMRGRGGEGARLEFTRGS